MLLAKRTDCVVEKIVHFAFILIILRSDGSGSSNCHVDCITGAPLFF